MISVAIPDDDAERLVSQHRNRLATTVGAADIERIVRIAHALFNADIILLALTADGLRSVASSCPLPAPIAVPWSDSFGAHTIAQDDLFVVPDARLDPRFQANPMVAGPPHIRFYAGQTLFTVEGVRIGTIALIAPEPRRFGEDSAELLYDLARMIELIVENRSLAVNQSALIDSLVTVEHERLIDPVSGLWNQRGLDDHMGREMARATRQTIPLAVALVRVELTTPAVDGGTARPVDFDVQSAAHLLLDSIRTTDVAAHLGDGTFALIMPGIYAVMVPAIAEKILRAFRRKAKALLASEGSAMTVSAGFTITIPRKGAEASAEALWMAADACLQNARGAGGDRFEIDAMSGLAWSRLALA